MTIATKAARLRSLLAFAPCAFLVGCTTFHPVDATPDEILESIAPGDTVRITTWDGSELRMLVTSVGRSHLGGRARGGSGDAMRLPLEQIDTIDVGRPNLKKAMLTTFVPAVIGAIIICNHQDCDTRSVVVARFEP